MSAQYDDIAEHYRRSKDSPLRTYVEAYTFEQMIGDVRGKRVLDLACGEGFYSRRLRALGADRVVGVDVSRQMIALAERQESENPLGIEYVCADVCDLGDLGRFDIVVAAYLLHYAPDAQDLERMLRNIRRHLPEGGRFVTLNENPDQPPARYAGYEQYGFSKMVEGPCVDGAPITYWMLVGRRLFKFHAVYFTRQTYETALAGAGFAGVKWRPPMLDPAGVAAHGADYWREYLANPPIVGLECRLRAAACC